MLVSIVMPVYNVEKYVEQALVSLFEQSYRRIEIIIVDDRGTDQSMSVVSNVISKYNTTIPVTILHHELNRGLSAARNTGIKAAKGDYIYFFDSDDALPNDSIESLVEMAEKHSRPDIVVGNMAYISRRGLSYEERPNGFDFSTFPEFTKDKELITSLFFDYSDYVFLPSTSTNKLYSLKFILDNRLSFYEGIIFEDEKFLFDTVNHIQTIGICKKITYHRFVTDGSITQSLNPEKAIMNWTAIINSAYPSFKSPFIGLKIASLICELYNLTFMLSKESRTRQLCQRLKKCESGLLRYTLKRKEFILALHIFLLLVFPISLNSNSFARRLFKRFYRIEVLRKRSSEYKHFLISRSTKTALS